MYRIWCERPLPPEYQSLLDNIAVVIGSGNSASNTLINTLDGAEAIIASARIRYDGVFMDRVPTLRVISRTGIGVDNIVIAEATARGIAVCNTPDVPSTSTAEHAVLLMLACLKQLKRWEIVLEQPERYDFFSLYQGLQAEGLTIGVIGLGRIGRRVARIATAIGMQVIGYDPYIMPDSAALLGVQVAESLEALLAAADVVSLHVPVSDGARHLMNAERLALMKPGAYLVNTARGSLVDEVALLDALERGHLAGAGLDVLDPEPPAPDNPLLHRDDVIVTPHIGGATLASKDRLWREAIHQALQVLRGERPPNLVNPEVWPPSRRA